LRAGVARARQCASLLLPLYAGEGIVRALTEQGRHAQVAAMATANRDLRPGRGPDVVQGEARA
jgi:hypothetical protein